MWKKPSDYSRLPYEECCVPFLQEKRPHCERVLDRGKKETSKTTNVMKEATVPDQVESSTLFSLTARGGTIDHCMLP